MAALDRTVNVKRVAVVVCGTGLVGAWLFAAVGTEPPPSAADASNAEQARPVDPVVADIEAEIARLRERLRDAPTPRRPARNPFLFAHGAPPTGSPAPETAEPTSVAVEELSSGLALVPDLRLVGIAEEALPDGGVRRTAIITGLGELFLVGVDELIANRFRVEAIGADAVQITDLAEGRSLTLALP